MCDEEYTCEICEELYVRPDIFIVNYNALNNDDSSNLAYICCSCIDLIVEEYGDDDNVSWWRM